MTRRLQPGDLVTWTPLDSAYVQTDDILIRAGDGSIVLHRSPRDGAETALVLRLWSPEVAVLDTWEGDVEVLLSTGRRGWVRESRLSLIEAKKVQDDDTALGSQTPSLGPPRED